MAAYSFVLGRYSIYNRRRRQKSSDVEIFNKNRLALISPLTYILTVIEN